MSTHEYSNIPTGLGDTYAPISNMNPDPNYAVIPDRTESPRKATDSWVISYSDLNLERKIGKGAFGVVYQGTWRSTPVAVKKFKDMDPKTTEEFEKEFQLMRDLKYHANVLQMYGMCTAPLALVTEYIEKGSLWSFLESSEPLSDGVRMKIIVGIARGMNFLHYENVIHRDLAARNVLLNSGFDPKIGDFGLSRKDTGKNQTTADIGPIRWMAPECLRERTYSFKTDVYAFGVTLIEIFTRQVPFAELDLFQLATKVGNGTFVPSAPPGVPPFFANIMNRCLASNPDDRPSFEQICAEFSKETSQK
eukprot:TRINITY_DN5544_c0_g1_i4.p1 TRINITY_DN5544_c0_g1~~TRINITY_DN5544_c0_g1_i4.p1  ORF type:complete len:306 (+),score=67.20 TRINITY_DN5544_c0_g1_i4:223-1140(+)